MNPTSKNPRKTAKNTIMFTFLVLFSGLIIGISLSIAGYSILFSLTLTVIIIAGVTALPVYLLSGGRV